MPPFVYVKMLLVTLLNIYVLQRTQWDVWIKELIFHVVMLVLPLKSLIKILQFQFSLPVAGIYLFLQKSKTSTVNQHIQPSASLQNYSQARIASAFFFLDKMFLKILNNP